MASVVGLIRNSTGQILFLQRSVHSSRPLQWCLPGGKIKNGELPAVALIREVKEETGLDVQVTNELADFGDQSYWNCELLSPTTIGLNERESLAFAWCDPRKILELGFIMDLKRLQQVLNDLGIASGHSNR